MTPEQLTNILVALIAGLTGSGGCSVILYLLQRRDKKKDGRTEGDKQRDDAMKRQSAMLLGLGHDRIVYLGGRFTHRDVSASRPRVKRRGGRLCCFNRSRQALHQSGAPEVP